MISSVINPAGVSRGGEFARTDEYIYIVMLGKMSPQPLPLSDDWRGKIKGGYKDKLRWNGLMRSGTNARREDRPNLFYPIYVSNDGHHINKIGNSIPLNRNRNEVESHIESVTIWPIRSDGSEGNWQISQERLAFLYEKGYVRLGSFTENGMSFSYLKSGEATKVDEGKFPIIGHRDDGSIIVDESDYEARFIPGTQWWITSHDATQLGTKLLNAIIGKRFDFPKSLYAVHDTIRFFVVNKPNALIVDFFAGSGTTLQAVNLLNAEDGGKRRCIMVTNNEVSEAEAKELKRKGYQPGDEEWERLGIARYVNWPRTVCSIEGHDVNGQPLKGEYLGTDKREMKEGFESNCVFFKLEFLDKTQVALGRQFRELLPMLWMKAGAFGQCPQLEKDGVPEMLVLPENHFAVLTDEKSFGQFVDEVDKHEDITMIYLVVDSDMMYREMAKQFPKKQTCQLYRDYLDNFRINVTR